MKPRRLTSFALSLAVLLLPAAPAHAAKSWKIRFHPKQGSVQYFAVSTELLLNADLGPLGRKSGRMKLLIELEQRVADRRRRGPTVLELTYERIQLDVGMDQRSLSYDSARSRPDDDPAARRYLGRMVGQVVTFLVSPRGEILEAHGLDGLWEEDPETTSGESNPLLESLAQGLGVEMLKGLYQQASPVFPEERVRSGATWKTEWTIPDPAFGTMRIDSDYELLGAGKLRGYKHVKTGVLHHIELEGRGPLLDRIGALAGAQGEVRVTTERSEGSGTIWTERKTGGTLGLLAQQQVKLRLSVPLKVLGFTQRVSVPVTLDQKITFERME